MAPIDLDSIRPQRRSPEHLYRDPLDAVWIGAVEHMGLRVVRADGAYADYDGRGTLIIGTERILDPDDCLAQILFHEICHWLVEGRDAVRLVGWGLCNETLRDLRRENACLRVQAALAAPFGLRRVLANTTDHRAYYDALPDDPLTQDDDHTVEPARLAIARAGERPWAPWLSRALEATATIVEAACPFAAEPSLFRRFEPRRAARSS